MKRQRQRRKLIDVDQVGQWELLYRMAANESSRRIVLRLAGDKSENSKWPWALNGYSLQTSNKQTTNEVNR